jgi:hypothetical protein
MKRQAEIHVRLRAIAVVEQTVIRYVDYDDDKETISDAENKAEELALSNHNDNDYRVMDIDNIEVRQTTVEDEDV